MLKSELRETEDWLAAVPSARDIPAGSRASKTEFLAARIQDQVAAILVCPADRIPRGAALQALGFASLHVVELQERLSRMSGVALSIVTLWIHPSIDAYAAFLLDAMTGSSGNGLMPGGTRDAIAGLTQEPGDDLDGLINNAGMMLSPGPFEFQAMENIQAQYDVNVFGMMAVTSALPPLLGTADNAGGHAGRIINISSIEGKAASPFISAYAATKHAIEGFSASLRRE